MRWYILQGPSRLTPPIFSVIIYTNHFFKHMPPFKMFTTKAKEAIRRAHELAIERGQNHVNPIHLLCALILQEESMVASILDKLEVDTPMLTDVVLEHIE